MAALMALKRLKKQGVEESGLLSSDSPTAEPVARRAPDEGQGGEERVQYSPQQAHGSATLRDNVVK